MPARGRLLAHLLGPPEAGAEHTTRARLLRAVAGGLSRVARDVRHAERSARFLGELHAFEPRDSDVFVCTYPRSGTTWTQYLVHLLLRDRDDAFRHIEDVAPWFERGLSLGRRNAAEFATMTSPRVFKTHLNPVWLPRRGRVVYVCRNVEDVVVSYHDFYRAQLGYTGSLDEFLGRFLSGHVQYRGWFEHVAAWRLESARRPVLWLRYEDMLADLPAAVRRLGHFLDAPCDREAVSEISGLGSFARMKADEPRFDHATADRTWQSDARGPFLRQGQRGEGRRRLDAAQLEALRARRERPTLRGRGLLDLPAFLH